MKPIKIPENFKNSLIADFTKFIETEKFSMETISYNKKIKELLPENIKKPTVVWTPRAYIQMRTLVERCDGEVAWHCVITRENDNYVINNILVYPQTVTGVTVTCDEVEYGKWLDTIPDNIFEKLRGQGHSHVNMSVNPSRTDRDLYDNFLHQLPKDENYLFMIFNKNGSSFYELYDTQQNVVFETEDITVIVLLDNNTSRQGWYEEVQKNITTKTYGFKRDGIDGYWVNNVFHPYSDASKLGGGTLSDEKKTTKKQEEDQKKVNNYYKEHYGGTRYPDDEDIDAYYGRT